MHHLLPSHALRGRFAVALASLVLAGLIVRKPGAAVFGEVVASGIHVLALWRQMDHEINWDIDWVCGVGWDELRLKRAIRAGDTIHVTSEIVSLEPSKTRTDRGTAMTRYAVVLEDGTEAVTFTSINLVYTRGARERMAGTAR